MHDRLGDEEIRAIGQAVRAWHRLAGSGFSAWADSIGLGSRLSYSLGLGLFVGPSLRPKKMGLDQLGLAK